MDALVTGVCAAGGLVAGGPLEVVVAVGQRRLDQRPWARCEACGATETGVRGLALVGAAWRRRCGSCGERRPLALRPLALGLVAAAVLAGFAVHFGADAALAAYAVLGLGLVALSADDLARHILPNRVLYPTLAAVAVLLVVASAVDGRWGSLARAAIGGAAGFVALYLVWLVYPRGMGFGDVRLAGLVGLASGWLGLGHTFMAFFAAFLLASVIGVAVMAATGQGRKTRIPFGPFLAAGLVVAVIWGNPLVAHLLHRSSG